MEAVVMKWSGRSVAMRSSGVGYFGTFTEWSSEADANGYRDL